MAARTDIEVFEYQEGRLLGFRTVDCFAMDHAIEVLAFLENEIGANVKDTGWKRGYGLEVVRPLPIHCGGVELELTTDGNEFVLARVGGSVDGFDRLCSLVLEMLGIKRLT